MSRRASAAAALLLAAVGAAACGRAPVEPIAAPLEDEEEAPAARRPTPSADAPLAVVMDVDGTIADESARRRAAAGADGQLDDGEWDAYFDPARVAEDSPIAEAVATLRALADSGVAILYVTARAEEACPATEAWIARHGLPAGPVRCRARRARTHDFKVEAITDLMGRYRILAGVGQEDRDGPPYREAGIEGVFVAENDDTAWRESARPTLLRLVESAGAGK